MVRRGKYDILQNSTRRVKMYEEFFNGIGIGDIDDYYDDYYEDDMAEERRRGRRGRRRRRPRIQRRVGPWRELNERLRRLEAASRVQRRQISGTENALVASTVVAELQRRFPDLSNNEILKTALPVLALWFLMPRRKGMGFEALISDPRVLGTALAAGAALISDATP
jgi:phage terminase Nu1 subunit (DNA packaging protein)